MSFWSEAIESLSKIINSLMNQSAKAYAPANISLIFKMHEHANPRWMGSYGVGFTIDQGVTAMIEKSETTKIFFNDKEVDFPAVSFVLSQLTSKPLIVTLTSPLPIGCGFGLSGASSLATAYAINALLGLEKTEKQLAILAHTADVTAKSGLGDVVNQFYGGVLVKFCPSSLFLVTKLPITTKKIYCKIFEGIKTSSVLTDGKAMEHIDSAADTALGEIKTSIKKKKISFAQLLGVAKQFAIESGLLQDERVTRTIAEVEKQGGHASMIMLGRGVVSDIPFEGSKEYKITHQGAKVMSS